MVHEGGGGGLKVEREVSVTGHVYNHTTYRDSRTLCFCLKRNRVVRGRW